MVLEISRRNRNRRGAITLEFILTLPVLLIAMFAVIQFAVYFANIQQVALASRVGAEAASQIELGQQASFGVAPVSGDGKVPDYVVDAVRQHLRSAGIEASCIILEHNIHRRANPVKSGNPASPHQVLVTQLADCRYEQPNGSLLPNSVRVTVCVRLQELMPNCLATFGFDISHKTAQQTTVFRHEL